MYILTKKEFLHDWNYVRKDCRMKRILLTALSLFLLTILCACGSKSKDNNETIDTNQSEQNSSNNSHVCTFDAREETVNPTCEDEGYTLHFCSCGNVREEKIAALGHSYSIWNVDTPPTLNSAGTLKRECANGHKEYIELPILSEEDYAISAVGGDNTSISCSAPTEVYYIYNQIIYDDDNSHGREFKFKALYTAEHTLSDTDLVYYSEGHYRACTVCGGFDKEDEEDHSMTDGKCTACGYMRTDFVYSEETYGLAVSYTANNYELIIPEYYSGSDITHIGKKIRGIKSLENNDGLRFLTIPASVRYIEPFAFEGCTSLERVYYEGTVEEWCTISFGAESNPMRYAKKFFMLNKRNTYEEVTDITIPDSVTAISSYAFDGFKSLNSLTIPKSITVFGDGLGDVFGKDTSIGTVHYNGDINDWCKIKFTARYSNPMQFTNKFYMSLAQGEYYQPTSLTITNDITEIGDYQFISYTPLSYIALTSPILRMGRYAFYGCTSLTRLDISKGCEAIDDYAFAENSMLMRLDIPKNLTKCGDFAFENCTRLTTIYYLGDWNSWSTISFSTVKSNPMHVNKERSFASSVNFYRYFPDVNEFYLVDAEVVTLSPNLEKIGDYQFYGFSKIAQIIVPNRVITIGKEAFAYCNNLNAIVIPKSVKSIAEDIIKGMKNFVCIYYEGSSDDFEGIEINSANTDLTEAHRYYFAKNESEVTGEGCWGYHPNGMVGRWLWDSFNKRWYLN